MGSTKIGTFYAYPLHNSGPFVYYQSLLSKDNPGAKIVASGATAYLNGKSNIATPETRRGKEKINQVLSVLKQMIDYEAAKEEAALNEIQSKILKMKTINVPSVKDDPYRFIALLNEAIKGHDAAIAELELERNRLHQAKTTFVSKTKEQISQMIKERPELASLLHNLSNALEGVGATKGNRMTSFTSLGKHNSIASKISTKIIEAYLPQLLQIQGGKITVNGQALNIVIGLITEEIRRVIYLQQGKITDKIAETYIQQIGQEGSQIDGLIKKMIENRQELFEYADTFGEEVIDKKEYEASLKGRKSAKRAQDLARSLGKAIPQPEVYGVSEKELKKMLGQLSREAVAATRAFSPKIYVRAEMNSALDFVKAIKATAVHTGGHTKDDIVTFVVTIDEDYEDNPKLRQLEKRLLEIQQAAAKKMEYLKGTADEYKKNSAIIEETLAQMEREYATIAKELEMEQDQLEEIVKLIKFHDNVKSYDTIDTKTKAFSGGSVGKDLREVLTNFTNMLSIAGYGTTAYDQEWLYTAIINTGKGLMGESLKGSLEEYLSSLMGLLLFDDAYFAVQEGTSFLKNNLINSSVRGGIHLYNLGGQYVPTSYILNETYKSLIGVLSSVDLSNGVKVSIKARPAQKKKFSNPEDWASERDASLSEANISVSFMANFLTFLDNLASAFEA